MRKLLALMATGLLALGMAGAANAAVLNFSGTGILPLADFPTGQFTGGGVATINGSDGVIPAHLSTLRLAESRGQVKGNFTRIVTDPDTIANGVLALIYENVGGITGTMVGLSGGAASTSLGGGNMGVSGLVKICLLSTACTQYLPLIFNQPTTVNGVPGTGTEGVGIGGLMTAGGYGGIRISLEGAPWTIKTGTVIDQIEDCKGCTRYNITWAFKGWAHAPVSTTTSTAQPSGVIQLVTPAQVTTNLPLGSSNLMAAGLILILHFVPEPGLLLLLGSGVAGLAFLGRRKMKR